MHLKSRNPPSIFVFVTYLGVGLLDGGPLDGVGPQVLEQVALVLILSVELSDLLRVQVLQEFCVVAL